MRKAILGLIGVGALLLAVSQFLPLFHTYVPSHHGALSSATVGDSHAYWVLVLAFLAPILGVGVVNTGSRFILVLVGLVGAAGLAVALGRDLSHARHSGLQILGINNVAEGHNVISVGLYVEIAGALLLMLAMVIGLLIAGPDLDAVARTRPVKQAKPPKQAPEPRERRPRGGMGGATGVRRRDRSETIGRRYDE